MKPSSQPQSKHPWASTAVVAFGLASIELLWLIDPGIQPPTVHYHWGGSLALLGAAIAADLLLYWLLLTLLLWAAGTHSDPSVERTGRLRVAIWGGILCFTPWVALQNVSLLLVHPSRTQNRVAFVAGFLSISLLMAFWRPSFHRPFESVIRFTTQVLSFTAIFGVYLCVSLGWHSWRAATQIGAVPVLHKKMAAAQLRPRIIWIIFDELSYQQAYEKRSPTLQMPAFDAMKAQSTVFTKAVPMSINTEVVVPALMTGTSIKNVRVASNGEYSIQEEASKRWMPLDPHHTVFQRALDAGYSTAVVGWYNPYCRMLPGVLDRCFWTSRYPIIANRMHPTNSVLRNMLEPLTVLEQAVFSVALGPIEHGLMRWLKVPHTDATWPERQLSDYNDLMDQTNQVLRDPSATFVLLHLPIPHPPGIYNRVTGTMTTGESSYLDNLALTDRCLATLRATLEQQGQWDASTIVIMGDHSWRTKQAWRRAGHTPRWTKEEEIASQGGQYDERPVYLVKLPNQTTPMHVDTVFHTLNTYSLLCALLQHSIGSPEELVKWAQMAR